MNRKIILDTNHVLREIFYDESNFDILQNFIEAILKIKISKMKSRRHFGKDEEGGMSEDSYGIATVRVTTEEGEKINIGIQILNGRFIQEQIIGYGAAIHLSQSWYEEDSEMVKTITINILDFRLFSNTIPHKLIRFVADKKKVYDDVQFHVLELPKYEKSTIETEEDAWTAYLKGDNDESVKKSKEKCEKINKLDQLLENYWDLKYFNNSIK